MHRKRANLIVNLRSGRTVVKVPEMVAVLTAAGWMTDTSLKEYRGETLPLARQAARNGHDMVIGYGGDGTINAVVNGVRYAGGKSIIADLPGGTFNEWAGEIAIPRDPVKAALALVDSVTCKIDLGFFQVESLTMPAGHDEHADRQEREEICLKPKKAGKHRQYFLLHAGLGIDAAIMSNINKPLKYELGKLAFDLAGLKELPRQRPFPVEIGSFNASGKHKLLWKGDAWQVVINNSRRYAGTIDLSPNAYIDDGMLDVTVIPAAGPLNTLEAAASFLFQHTIDTATTHYFHGPHLSISVPASIELELDGSVVKLKDFLRKTQRMALEQAEDAEDVMVRYRFDAVPAAARIAFPSTYDGSMFEKPAHKKPFEQAARRRKQREEQLAARQQEQQEITQARQEFSGPIEELRQHGRIISVAGVATHPHHPEGYIIAGAYRAKKDAQIEPAAVRVKERTLVLNRQGEQVSHLLVANLQEGDQIAVDGKKSKRGVIDAHCLMIL